MAGRNESKKEFAFMLYKQGITQKEILERVGIGSSRTLNKWIKEGGWKEKRAAMTITRGELINKTLKRINELLEADDKIDADKLAKLASTIEKLDKKDSPVIYMGCFTDFGNFLQSQATTDVECDIEFMKKVNRYQDMMITQKLNS